MTTIHLSEDDRRDLKILYLEKRESELACGAVRESIDKLRNQLVIENGELARRQHVYRGAFEAAAAKYGFSDKATLDLDAGVVTADPEPPARPRHLGAVPATPIRPLGEPQGSAKESPPTSATPPADDAPKA